MRLFGSDNFNRRDADIYDGANAKAVLAAGEEIELGPLPGSCRAIG
jgi:hypothetical protein